MPEQTARLAQRVEELTAEVGDLKAVVENFQPEVRAAKRSSSWASMSVLVLLVLVVLLAVFGVQLWQTTARVNDVINKVNCPFYSLILGSYNPMTRPEGADRDKYVQNFAEMQRQRDALGCAAELTPPRIGG